MDNRSPRPSSNPPHAEPRPRVSFLIFAYNHERFIARTLQGAFEQGFASMEIIVTDDCSTDSTLAVIERAIAAYDGPKRIILNRTPVNLGLGGAINSAVALTNGELLIINAGDDESVPERTEAVVAAFDRGQGAVKCVYSNAVIVDEDGRAEGQAFDKPQPVITDSVVQSKMVYCLGATTAYHRDLFDVFGPLRADLVFEDTVLPLRAAIVGRIEYLHDPLVRYRRHGGNLMLGAMLKPDKADWYANLSRHADRLGVALECWIADIETAQRLYGDQERRLHRMKAGARNRLKQLRAKEKLLKTGGLRARLLATVRFLMSTPRIDPIKAWMITFFLPGIYLRHKFKAEAAANAKR